MSGFTPIPQPPQPPDCIQIDEPSPILIRKPTLKQLAVNFYGEISKWATKGFKTTTQEQYQARLSTCRSCEHWNEEANMNFGKCAKCGCTGSKLWLASSKCPINLWKEIV